MCQGPGYPRGTVEITALNGEGKEQKAGGFGWDGYGKTKEVDIFEECC